jgi:hypothetical protein
MFEQQIDAKYLKHISNLKAITKQTNKHLALLIML